MCLQGCVQDFRKGGPISLGSLKKRSSDFKRGVQWFDRGVQYISLPRTTNLAYLDAKEKQLTNMYFEPLISVKCCPKMHIKQLRNNLHYIRLKLHVLVLKAYCEIGLGGRRGGEGTDEKGGSRKRGVRTP